MSFCEGESPLQQDYNSVDPEIIGLLEQIGGADSVFTDEDVRQGYACDEMPVPAHHLPEVVVKPRDAVAVGRILRLASERRIPVTPRGAGTGVCGGCVPLFGGILLSLERMDRILEIDTDNLIAVVEPAVTLAALNAALESHGLYYPVYPGESNASIGGTVATNAGGMKAVKHGVTRNHVMGLEAALPTGAVIDTGGKFVKSSTGYDLTQLLTGSEGTLAVITKIILRLGIPPKHMEVLFIPFEGLDDAIGAVPLILKEGNLPAGIEFMERDIIRIVEEDTGKEVPHHDYAAFLLVILEGQTEADIHEQAGRIEKVCLDNGAAGVLVPPGAASRRRLLEMRESFYPAIKRLGPIEVADVVVPRSRIAEFVKQARSTGERHGVPVISYGHAGDGNVHVHLLGKGLDGEEWRSKRPAVMEDIYRLGAALGGVISGEHGLGYEKKDYLGMAVDPEAVRLMREIKRVFDPHNILNPGKVFDPA